MRFLDLFKSKKEESFVRFSGTVKESLEQLERYSTDERNLIDGVVYRKWIILGFPHWVKDEDQSTDNDPVLQRMVKKREEAEALDKLLDGLMWAIRTRVLTDDEMQIIRDNESSIVDRYIGYTDESTRLRRHYRKLEFDAVLAAQAGLKILSLAQPPSFGINKG